MIDAYKSIQRLCDCDECRLGRLRRALAEDRSSMDFFEKTVDSDTQAH